MSKYKSVTIRFTNVPADLPEELLAEAAVGAVRNLEYRAKPGPRNHPFEGPEVFDDYEDEDVCDCFDTPTDEEVNKAWEDALLSLAYPHVAEVLRALRDLGQAEMDRVDGRGRAGEGQTIFRGRRAD